MNSFSEFYPTKESFDALKSAIENEGENPCRDKLVPFSQVLAKKHNIRLEYAYTEYCTSGIGTRADIIICGTPHTLSNPETHSLPRKKVILYECKSPKNSIFDKVKNGRPLPTEHLIEAETQLLDYIHDVSNVDGTFRDLIGASNVHPEMGGIIIGRSSNNPSLTLPSFKRQQYLYKERINLYTWDNIISVILEDYPSFAEQREPVAVY
ncbi:MAG: hypothetical protein PQ612_02130 [Rickettsiales bacterium]|nr:hypothetical protein [Pseudomonadota bacterium]MDA0967076.1 hypothetical protein [Pseudomonadota bacterium]MDG4542438.1 hypothetical protein [Rickettsiales bacterium]MDG4544942.1 hypothetical protein [Rickettsiales bacterium]MDG4547065.1 hypothetical protein [Rickettsiales bacterium]